jgi:hypothetical protein
MITIYPDNSHGSWAVEDGPVIWRLSMTENALFEMVSWFIAAVAVPISAQLMWQSWSVRKPAAVERRDDDAKRTAEGDRPV